MWILNVALVDKIKIETTINDIDVTADMTWTSISNHFTDIL